MWVVYWLAVSVPGAVVALLVGHRVADHRAGVPMRRWYLRDGRLRAWPPHWHHLSPAERRQDRARVAGLVAYDYPAAVSDGSTEWRPYTRAYSTELQRAQALAEVADGGGRHVVDIPLT